MMSNSTATERALMFSSEVCCMSCHTSLARGVMQKKNLLISKHQISVMMPKAHTQ
jgi:hypothetical protein